MNCAFGSIRQIQRQLVSEGINVSEHALRSWVKSGQIPVKYSGKKALLLYSDVLKFLGATISPLAHDVA